MHRSNKQRVMNKTFTVLSNKYCSSHHDVVEQDQSNLMLETKSPLSTAENHNRFCTFTKYKIKQQQQQQATVVVNQQRYFDSPTMIIPDDDQEIPVSRCSNKTSITATPTVEPSLDETELSDLFIFTNPNRVLTESMHVVISRHPSLQDLKYVNDVSSVLLGPPVIIQVEEEPIYQELIRVNHLISTPPNEYWNDVDENKENRPPLMPIKCPVSRIPVWTPSPADKAINTPMLSNKTKKHERMKNKMTTKPCLTDILDDWSCVTPKLKELLTDTRKMPLRMPQLTTNSNEFRRLKQLLNDLEVITSSWTNAINQCRYVLQHAQQQLHRS